MRMLLHHQSSGLFFDYESLVARGRVEFNVPRPNGLVRMIEYDRYLIDVPTMLVSGALRPVVLLHDSLDDLMQDQGRMRMVFQPGDKPPLWAILLEQEALWLKIKRNGGITPC